MLMKKTMISLGLTGLFCVFSLCLYSLCLERQSNFEAKLVELDELKTERRQLREHNERLRDRVAYLQTDAGVEEVAREKLGLVRPGELAYAVVPPPPDSFTEADEKESPHLHSAEHKAEQQEDYGLIVRVLRRMFSTQPAGESKDVAAPEEAMGA
jgi:cell division protein FtsB